MPKKDPIEKLRARDRKNLDQARQAQAGVPNAEFPFDSYGYLSTYRARQNALASGAEQGRYGEAERARNFQSRFARKKSK